MNLFETEDFKIISELVENKIPLLRENENFNKDYLELFDKIDKFEVELSDLQKENFEEITRLFYKAEQYYFALAYSLGVKY